MTRILIYLFFIMVLLYFLFVRGKYISYGGMEKDSSLKPKRPFRSKAIPGEVWTQVYETAEPDEARMLQARLQEEEIECVLYEQGKKDIHGHPLKGIGIAVPKSSVSHAQRIISRMPA